jgi:hypothetical protein
MGILVQRVLTVNVFLTKCSLFLTFYAGPVKKMTARESSFQHMHQHAQKFLLDERALLSSFILLSTTLRPTREVANFRF